MAEVLALNKLRASLKGKLTKFANFLANFDLMTDDLTDIQARYPTFVPILKDYELIQNKIDKLITTEQDVEANDKYRDEFEQKYFDVSKAFIKLIGTHNIPSHNDSFRAPSQPVSAVQLPKLQVPKFNGAMESWSSYRDIFINLIHTNPHLDTIVKFQYLRDSLIGSVSHLLDTFPVNADSYQQAWNYLINKFNHSRNLVHHYLSELFKASRMSNQESPQLGELVDIYDRIVRLLDNSDLQVYEYFPVYMLLQRLPDETRQAFLNSLTDNALPTFTTLRDFVQRRLQSNIFRTNEKSNKGRSFVTTLPSKTDSKVCILNCKPYHPLFKCPLFKQKTPNERYEIARNKKLCINCLFAHSKPCYSQRRCQVCNRPHHTLLHFPQSVSTSNNTTLVPTSNEPTQVNAATFTTLFVRERNVILPTAKIIIVSPNGEHHEIRALLDSASQVNFITEHFVKKLKLQQRNVSTLIDGISSSRISCSSEVSFDVRSRQFSDSFHINAVVLTRIADYLPNEFIDVSTSQLAETLVLADPSYNSSGPIDLLLGASVFFEILRPHKIKCPVSGLIYQDTVFGHIVSGKYRSSPNHQRSSYKVTACSSIDVIHKLLSQFWEIETVPARTTNEIMQDPGEIHFANTFERDGNGRYTVSLPFKGDPPDPTNSEAVASKRLKSVEHRLVIQPAIYDQYRQFMRDYCESNHMTRLSNSTDLNQHYFIPHHFVLKPESTTTKLRVVFDGSCKMANGTSLNEHLHTGPKLQQDLLSILLRFRFHRYVFIADIRQMYRQIQIKPEDRIHQCIVWRETPDLPLQHYQLNTVTYGLAPSPYLAIRTLHQLARDEPTSHPSTSRVIQEDMYVDDLASGSDSLSSALNLQQDLIRVLQRGGFELRKWASNSNELLSSVSSDYHNEAVTFQNTDATVRILGVKWIPTIDCFSFNIQPFEQSTNPITKRKLLSDIARLYDPCGWLAPIIIVSKIIMQQLWEVGLTWDAPVSDSIHDRWICHRKSFSLLSDLHIPRYVFGNNCPNDKYQLHGFCDSSERAYGATIYVVYKQHSHLLVSKTRVSPLKRISIPRLELCAAVLLANLFQVVLASHKTNEIYAWSDSMIALTWIKSHAFRWTTFVANRVTLIQQAVPPHCWRHVPSNDNPADLASRGITTKELMDSSIWWHGPHWLTQEPQSWPSFNIILKQPVPEEKLIKSVTQLSANVALQTSEALELMERYSDYTKLIRIIAYMYRFMYNIANRHHKRLGFLTVSEYHNAEKIIIRKHQELYLSNEVQRLRAGQSLSASSSISSLTPFLDTDGILRVGGRLDNASLPYDQRHPVILPNAASFTRKLIIHTHEKYLHIGIDATLAVIRRRYWIIHARSLIRKMLHQCFRCRRTNPIPMQPFMGSLPSHRVNPALAFQTCGLDYAGPFLMKQIVGRSRINFKAYAALFVCCVTKAVHIELVTNLSTNAFIAALRRFIARRGVSTHIYSDNGTNFIGAKSVLQELYSFLRSNVNEISSFASQEKINWHFIPPSSPHFGGLWEAGIKSMKTHLYRVVGAATLNFEELATLLVQIQACMNSRPLVSLSDDPNDLQVLTPGHFLIGRAITAIPDPSAQDLKHRDRWKLLQAMINQFWKTWQSEYLNTLQQRRKWKTNAIELKLGDLVLILNSNLHPTSWLMGRVVQLFPGTDGKHRVAEVRTKNGILRRPLVKLHLLPRGE